MQNKKLKCVAFIFKLMRNLALLQMSEGCPLYKSLSTN